MPARIRTSPELRPKTGITKFTNCRLIKGKEIVAEDLYISSETGKILHSQVHFYEHQAAPDEVIDLGGRILAPGFIDVQLNGAFGFDFSVIPENASAYVKGLRLVCNNLVKTGVTSFLPTLTTQKPDIYQRALPYLGPSGVHRLPSDGAESLGVHCEGPFLSPTKNGVHPVSVLREAPNGFSDVEACYGAQHLEPHHSPIKLLTLAPELPGTLESIPELTRRGITVSIGHSETNYEGASAAMDAGATMITHLFNAMRPLHHRNPGIFGLLGTPAAPGAKKPYFGIIADGVHLHPTSIVIAWHAHPSGFILVTDAMRLNGLPDGVYDWNNGQRMIKKGYLLTLEGTDKIAGSAVSLVDCVNNFLNWSGATIPEAVCAVTATPAKMLGLEKVKGTLEAEADADLVVLDELVDENGARTLKVDQVWKFGTCVFQRS